MAKFFDSATVKGALVSGVISFVAVLVAVWLPSRLDAPRLRDEIQRLRDDGAAKDTKITELQTILIPFKTIAFQNFSGTEAERLSQLAVKLTDVQKGLELLSSGQTAIKTKTEEVDALAKEAQKKVVELEVITAKATTAQEQLSNIADFNLLLTRANNDDRAAFDRLWQIYQQGAEPNASIARQAVAKIATDAQFNFEVKLDKIRFDPASASIGDYAALLISGQRADFIVTAIGKLSAQERFTKKERLQVLVDTIAKTNSVRVLHSACITLNNEAKIDKNVIAWPLYIEWWEKNRGNYF